jgi:hypothetical protein
MGDVATVQPPSSNGKTPTVVNSTNPAGCLLQWDLNGSTAGTRYVVQVVGESQTHASASRTVADFVVEMVSSLVPACTGPSLVYAYSGVPNQISYEVAATNGSTSMTPRAVGWPGVITPTLGEPADSPVSLTHQWTPVASDHGRIYGVWIGATDSQNSLGHCTSFLIGLANDVFANGFESDG